MSAIIRVDNQSALKLAKNQIPYERTNHIDIRHHFIRKFVDMGRIELEYIKSEDNTTDVLTKALHPLQHNNSYRLTRDMPARILFSHNVFPTEFLSCSRIESFNEVTGLCYGHFWLFLFLFFLHFG